MNEEMLFKGTETGVIHELVSDLVDRALCASERKKNNINCFYC